MRPYSSHLLVSPIDYPFLGTAHASPNVLVTVNGIPSVCLGDCSYTFLGTTPTLTSMSLTGTTLTLSISDPLSAGHALSDTSITLGGSTCTISNPGSATLANFNCELPANSDGTPTVESGNYLPMIKITPIGEIPIDSAVTA